MRIGGRDLVAFKLGAHLAVPDVSTDADSVFLRPSGEAVERMVVDSATRLTWRSRELLSSPTPLTLAVTWDAAGVRGTARAASATSFWLAAFGGSSPRLRVSVPAGESTFSVPYR